jgi:hypothetical protein
MSMHRFARLALALALLCGSFTYAPTTKATGCSDIFTTFYDCCLNEVGSRYVLCTGGSGNTGTQAGAFKEVEVDPSCCGGTPTITWYQWNGSSWVQLSSAPSAGCHC